MNRLTHSASQIVLWTLTPGTLRLLWKAIFRPQKMFRLAKQDLVSLMQGDVMLRALRFMDSMIQRDTVQKAAFLNDLATFWDRFDDRVLRLKVCAEEMIVCNAVSDAMFDAVSDVVSDAKQIKAWQHICLLRASD